MVASFLGLVLAACLLPALPGAAQERGARRERPKSMGPEDLRHILDGLERGMVALKELGRHEELEVLERVANDVRRELRQAKEKPRRGDGEREILHRQLKALRLAHAALREGEKLDAADIIHRAIRAREVNLEGRRDEEAHKIRERAPDRERTTKLLVLAEHLYREWGNEERASALSRMTEELWPPRRRREAGRERPRTEREVAHHQIDVMKLAKPALLEAGRKDTCEILEHAIHARELALQGRTDDEAIRIRETAPNLGQQIEILQYSSKLWRKYGNVDKAEALGELANHFAARSRRLHRDRPEKPAREHHKSDREALKHQMEIMKMGVHALLEVDKKEAAESLERAIHARRMDLEGRHGKEARIVRERAPGLEDQAELLGLAARLWRKFGNQEKAGAVGGLAEKMWAQAKKRTDRAERGRERKTESAAGRIERLHHRLEEMQRGLNEMREELKDLLRSHW